MRWRARPGRSLLIPALLIGLTPLATGCGAGESARVLEESEDRAVVRRFWSTLNEATQRRMRGDLEGAVIAYRDALGIDPDHEDALYYLGQCLRTLGRHAEALGALERLVTVNPNSSRGHIALGAIHATPDERALFDPRVAADHFRRAHDINAEETGPMLRLGEVLLVAGETREAGDWFEATLQSNPKSVEAACLAGYLAWRRGDRDGARSFHDRALAAGRTEAPIAGVLGEGDRRAAPGSRTPLPPIDRPMGRTLFGDLCAALPSETDDPDIAFAPIGAHADRLASLADAPPGG